ncbi:AAA domain-containing protein [Pseudomonas purpurea]|uniref:DEAD/DEAH box helicase n=1 Tax=Pseudomonas purpurea TaxID=3136737 RepID=UPI00326379D8
MTMTPTDRVLNFWHSVEFFNAYNLDQPLEKARRSRSVELLDERSLSNGTWDTYVARRRVLYLLPFEAAHATGLIEQYVDGPQVDEITRVRDGEMAPTGLTCFARLSLDEAGVPDFQGFSLSTLPWAMGRLVEQGISALCAESFEASVATLKRDLEDDWSRQEHKVFGADSLARWVERLKEWALFTPPEASLAYLDAWPLPKSSKNRTVEPEAAAEALEEQEPSAELPILNSFYVHDLAHAKRVLASANPPRALKAYLSAVDATKLDLDGPLGQEAIRETLRPANGIGGRWPSESRHVQSLMQQFALNKMRAMGEGEILAVNGPPGTGKTTLLRDLIAHLVVERAQVLSGLAEAKHGLSGRTVEAVFAGDTYTIPVLSEALTGFEILVASTNNGAVENLSLELPQLKGIDPARASTLGYFTEVATRYAGVKGDKPWSVPEPVWGLVSAALGKKANRRRFKDIFGNRAATPGDTPGFRFLGNDKVDWQSWDSVGAMTYWRYKSVTESVQPGFQVAKQRFLKAREVHDQLRAQLEILATLYADLQRDWKALQALWPAAPTLSASNLTSLTEGAARLLTRLETQVQGLERKLGPALFRWLAQWFRKPLLKEWTDACTARDFVKTFESHLHDVPALLKTCDVNLWDGASLDSHANQEKAFWQGARMNEARSELFSAAMVLHQAFFLEVAERKTLFALSAMLDRPPLLAARKALWQWFFMLTPVVSSTFASIRSQFSGLEPESLGWLIIDEAGQAPPQAAVGAIMRARRVVVVGDPLQIEPVVTQSTRLLASLGKHWLDTQCSRYAVDSHSVQSLADRGYAFGVRHPVDQQAFIGIPLVMHRRCDNPMFEIANAIAYADRMKHARPGAVSAHPVLGPSAWWDIGGQGEAGTKYVATQGQRLLQALLQLYAEGFAEHGARMPAVFVITPFREVKEGLLSLLGQRTTWETALTGSELPVPKDLDSWAKASIGTVHTFQGKEADIVFFVLGCDATRGGAIDWAASRPNLLNVAVTRARHYLFILGERNLWGTQPHFDVALARLSRSCASSASPSLLAEQAMP